MSGIAGFCNLDDAPADPALLRRMALAIAPRGPDAISYWVAGSVAFAHLMLRTTPESLHETQPLVAERGDCSLTLDGRVDNRDELRATLEAKGHAPRADTDAELVLRAYECWGEDCAAHILGDFAFALWDGRKRALFCARDLLGIRPFYYSFDGRAFRFASELRALLAAPGIERQLNRGMFGEYLCDNVRSLDETLYRNLLRLPPAHRLTLRAGRLRIERYFEFDPGRTIRYASDAEYAEHFFELFRRSVSARLRSQAPVALFLSGGLDSASILGMAGALLAQGAIGKEDLASYTLTFSDSNADESGYVGTATAPWPFAAHRIDAAELDNESLAEAVRRRAMPPDAPNLAPWQGLCERAGRNGSRVCLWGLGGDEWLTGDETHCADSLRRFRLATALRQFHEDRAQSRIWGERDPWLSNALHWCIYPLVPRGFKAFAHRILQPKLPAWISPAFAHSVGLRERLLRAAPAPRFPTAAQQRIHAQLASGQQLLAKEELNAMEASCSIEGRHPFHDRRIIEFALALPEEQRWHGAETKYVLRQAMRRHLPDSIRRRRDKAEFGSLFARTFERERAGQVFGSMRLAEEGYVDALVVRKLYERYQSGADDDAAWPLWTLFAAEFWLRNASII